jgi:CheY-like chemotaxis protein
VPIEASVYTDPVLAGRILRNLVENAIRYTETGGVLIGARRRGEAVRVEVWDTGVGIRDDVKSKIFEEFFQIGNSERDRRKGLGLGLAIVQRLARLLEHPLQLHSRPGRGSVFTLDLPLVSPAVLAEAIVLQCNEPARGSVLIIDDEAAVARATAALVDALGYDACAVESADQALQLVQRGCRPTAIIADYRLRDGENGIEAIRLLCRECSHRVPSLLITGDTAPDRLREAEAAGITTLHKPVRPAELERALADLVTTDARRVSRACMT